MGQSEAHKKNKELVEAQNLNTDRKLFQNSKIFWSETLYIVPRKYIFDSRCYAPINVNPVGGGGGGGAGKGWGFDKF